jgi:chromosomal replication initiator protein DnaA
LEKIKGKTVFDRRGFALSTELRIPEGIIVRTARGGPDILKGILGSLKEYSFAGYIKVVLKKENLSSTGYIVVDQGEPTMAIYQFEKKEPREMKRIYAGDKAFRFIWEDSQDKISQMELHSRVPKEEFDRRFPDARLKDLEDVRDRVSKTHVARKVAPEPAEEPAVKEEDPLLSEIAKMRQDGYIVEELERLYRSDRSAVPDMIARYRDNIEELVSIGQALDSLPRKGFEEDIDRLRSRLNDPAKLDSLKIDVARFRESAREKLEHNVIEERRIAEDIKKKKADEKSGDLSQLILQYRKVKAPEGKPDVCGKCGGTLDESGECPKCANEAGDKRKAAIREEFGFENFVVGQGNKFAYAAATAVAEAPDKAYNPLFIYGKSGLGKTHLLNAIANRILTDDPNGGVALISAEKFTEDLERAVKKDELHEFRDGLRRRKALIIDDFQFLAGKEAAQGELLYLFEEVRRNGGQIVVASDRLPKEIPDLSESLAAKIQGGLIADIQAPDEPTRIAILKKKAKGKGKDIPENVIEFLAQKIPTNVRDMEAALNRLIAFATVMKVAIDLRLANEVLAPTMTATEETHEASPQVDIKPGHSYLVEEDRPSASILLYMKKIDEGYKGLHISRLNPKQVKQEFGTRGEIFWLTDKDSKTEKTIAPSLEVIIHAVEEYMVPGGKGILLIDGLQYLVSNTSFEGVLRFIRRLIDDFSESGSIMMMSVSPGTLKAQELSILERELEAVKLE